MPKIVEPAECTAGEDGHEARNAARRRALGGLLLENSSSVFWFTPGAGIQWPMRNTASIPSVKRILPRSSAIRKTQKKLAASVCVRGGVRAGVSPGFESPDPRHSQRRSVRKVDPRDQSFFGASFGASLAASLAASGLPSGFPFGLGLGVLLAALLVGIGGIEILDDDLLGAGRTLELLREVLGGADRRRSDPRRGPCRDGCPSPSRNRRTP